MAPFGLKLWGNAFQMIPNISFFDVEKKKIGKIFRQNFIIFFGGDEKIHPTTIFVNFLLASKNEMLGII